MLRAAGRNDTDELISLWKEAFEESEELIHFTLDRFAGFENIYVWEMDGRIISMLCAVPCSLPGQKGCYLYGVATRKQWRGQGIMKAMMRDTEMMLRDNGITFCCLVPASPGLYNYYGGMGYESGFLHYYFQLDISVQAGRTAVQIPVTPENLTRLRQSIPIVTLTQSSLQAVLENLVQSGAELWTAEGDYLLCHPSEEGLICDELYAGSNEAANALISAAGTKGGWKTIQGVSLCPKLFPDAQQAPSGMIKYLKHPPCHLRGVRMNLMFN